MQRSTQDDDESITGKATLETETVTAQVLLSSVLKLKTWGGKEQVSGRYSSPVGGGRSSVREEWKLFCFQMSGSNFMQTRMLLNELVRKTRGYRTLNPR